VLAEVTRSKSEQESGHDLGLLCYDHLVGQEYAAVFFVTNSRHFSVYCNYNVMRIVPALLRFPVE
jgi:hypothetical protein